MGYIKAFFVVTLGSFAGMVMGELFGPGSGLLAPGLFSHIIPWTDVEPVGAAAVYGAIIGVLLGGGLAVFSIIMSVLSEWIKTKEKKLKAV